MFTGRFPFEHGAHTLGPETGAAVRPLHKNSVTLAEVLQGLGYQTAAVVANAGYLAPRWRLNQGFETYQVEWNTVDAVNAHVLAGAQPRAGASLPVRELHGRASSSVQRQGTPRPPPPAGGPGPGPGREAPLRGGHAGHRPRASPELIQTVSDQYDTSLGNLDQGLGQLFDALSQQGLLEDATVVVTSDHGEYIGEHSLVEHSKDVYQEALWVPLVVKAPRQRGRQDDARLASHVDIPRLVLSTLKPDLVREGLVQFPYAVGGHPSDRPVRLHAGQGPLPQALGWRLNRVRTALFDERLKLIASSDGQHELYDLAGDPREGTNLMASRAATANRMLHALESFRKSRTEFRGRSEAAPQPSAEELEQRRALGYVGGPEEEGGETGPRR